MTKIKKLKTASAPGPSDISPRFLQDHISSMSGALTHIFNLSMQTGDVPFAWKCANVTPAFKKGSRVKPENYRPISLTEIPCKLMESIICDEIVEHLSSNQLIRSSQHGFLRKKSCLKNQLSFLEILTNAHEQGKSVDIVFLDFAKAFDKVPKQRLLEKIQAHGIQGNVINWIHQWLSGRKQRVVINGSHSDWSDVKSGVPQGSILGPLAFIIFINDIDCCAEMIDVILKFADDTKAGHQISADPNRQSLQNMFRQPCRVGRQMANAIQHFEMQGNAYWKREPNAHLLHVWHCPSGSLH